MPGFFGAIVGIGSLLTNIVRSIFDFIFVNFVSIVFALDLVSSRVFDLEVSSGCFSDDTF